VEQGVAFCRACSAPQIRVVVAEPAATPADSPDSAMIPDETLPASQTVPVLALPMRWSQAVKPCALAALIAAVAMVCRLVVPLIAVLGAGFLAVAFYRRNTLGAAVRAGAGARLGALCGAFCAAMTAVLAALRIILLHEEGEIRQMLLDLLQQNAARYPDSQSQATLEFLRTPAGLVFMMAFLLIFAFFMFLFLATVGGAIGGAVMGRRDKS